MSSARFSSYPPEYDHTQTSPLPWLIAVPFFAFEAVLLGVVDDPQLYVMLPVVTAIVLVVAFAFERMRIRDDGDSLLVRFGPLPLFRKRVAYVDIAAAAVDRTSVIDGWGIHWVPGRGWTYNVWGFQCVRITLRNGRTVRLGTDDAASLCAHLHNRIGLGT